MFFMIYKKAICSNARDAKVILMLQTNQRMKNNHAKIITE